MKFADGSTVRVAECLGGGNTGVVFRLGDHADHVIKIAWKPALAQTLLDEAKHAAVLAHDGFDVCPVVAVQRAGVPYLIKPYEPGVSLDQAARTGLSDEQIDGLAYVYVLGLSSRFSPDILGSTDSNLVWSETLRRWVLIDTETTEAPLLFMPLDYDRYDGVSTFARYVRRVFRDNGHAAKRFREKAAHYISCLGPPRG